MQRALVCRNQSKIDLCRSKSSFDCNVIIFWQGFIYFLICFSNRYMDISRFFVLFDTDTVRKSQYRPEPTVRTICIEKLWFYTENRENGPWISPFISMYRVIYDLIYDLSKHSTEVSSWRIPRPSDSILVSITCEIQENCKTMSRPVKNHCNQSKSGHWRTEK